MPNKIKPTGKQSHGRSRRGFRIGTLGGPETNEENGPARPAPTRKRKEERITAAPETQSKDTKA